MRPNRCLARLSSKLLRIAAIIVVRPAAAAVQMGKTVPVLGHDRAGSGFFV